MDGIIDQYMVKFFIAIPDFKTYKSMNLEKTKE